MTIVEAARAVTGGIDTHGEVHVAAVLDEVGGLLGTQSFRADPDGYSDLLSLAPSLRGDQQDRGGRDGVLWGRHRSSPRPSRGPRR